MFGASLALWGWLEFSGWIGNTQIHTLTEAVGSSLALLVGPLALVRYYSRRSNAYLFLATAFLGTGVLDGYHAVVTSSFFAELFPSPAPSLIPWSWNASRIYLALLLALGYWGWRREDRMGAAGAIRPRNVYLGTAVLTLGSFYFFAFVPLPRAYYPELVLGRPEELLAGAVFLGAAIGYYKKGLWRTDYFEKFLLASLVVNVFAQAPIMARSFGLFDAMFDAAHLLKVFSYVLVLAGLLYSQYGLFVAAEQNMRELGRAREAAVESARLKSEFLATMSHEIRTPMNGVLGMAELLSETPLDDSQKEFVQTIRSSGEALLTIINDILDFSKIEAGRLEMEQAAFNLREVVEQTADLLAPRAKEGGGEIVVLYPPAEPETFVGDSARVRQVVTNLVSNAVKFTDGGHVLIRVELGESYEADSVVCIHVEDTGIGIPADKLDHIFDSFSQADASTTRRFGGTGLGLAICRRLTEMMGGDIQVRSRVGEGSTFTVRMRLGPAAQPAPEPVPEWLAGLRILAVEELPAGRRRLSDLFGSRVARLAVVSDCVEARDRIGDEGPFDCLLLDPEAEGFAGLAEAACGDPKLGGPAVFSFDNSATDQEASPAGPCGHSLVKPLNYARILRVLSESFATTAKAATGCAATPVATAAETGAEANGVRVLVADDSAVNLRVAQRMLERLGCRVDVAVDGAEACEMNAAGDYALILMDCHMPIVDGFEASRSIRERGGGRGKVPIIALTANAMAGDRERCLEAGMDDYVSKPVSMDDLAKAIQRWAPAEVTAKTQPHDVG